MKLCFFRGGAPVLVLPSFFAERGANKTDCTLAAWFTEGRASVPRTLPQCLVWAVEVAHALKMCGYDFLQPGSLKSCPFRVGRCGGCAAGSLSGYPYASSCGDDLSAPICEVVPLLRWGVAGSVVVFRAVLTCRSCVFSFCCTMQI